MCGVTGVVSSRPEDLRAIAAMTSALRHRGPDDEGYLLADTARRQARAYGGPDTVEEITHPSFPVSVPAGTDLALGHRRLAILDLTAAGHGPMATEDGSLWLSYNGEIYNYIELRAELSGLGHRFRTGTDTEVLLAAYRQWGTSALHRFNGMWAFALYDAPQRILFCARDRFGVKPLHYSWDGDALILASEVKGLLAHPRVRREIHVPTLTSFLVDGAVDEGAQTFYSGIESLPAGHQLTLAVGERRLEVQRWYTLPDATDHDTPRDESTFRDLLHDAVAVRLRSDVPVGTCLSGGIDSSSIVALVARLGGGSDRRSFSVVYSDPEIDERRFIRQVVTAAGVDDRQVTPTSSEALADLPRLICAQDEPVPSAGVYSQWRVMALARESGTTVLIDGQGADEVLGGYHYHFGPRLAEVLLQEGPAAAWRQGLRASEVTGRPLRFFLGSLAYHLLPLPEVARREAVRRSATHGRVPASAVQKDLLRSRTTGRRHRPRRSLAAERRANILETSLPALLRYEDRNSMAFSVEARTPFLDYRLVELAMRMPADALISDGWTKLVLRRSMAGVVPDDIRWRRDKIGFGTPERRWLEERAQEVRARLASSSAVASLLRKGVCDEWLAGDDATLARRPGLWRLLAVAVWGEQRDLRM
jgi:asparagine synthase (glutamine-hydrolysing)